MKAKDLAIVCINCVLICAHLSSGSTISRQSKSNSSTVNWFDRSSRQTFGGYGGYGGLGSGYYGLNSFGGPLEAVVIGLLVVVGISIIGLPFILLFMNAFNGNGFPGIGPNLVPTTTTTVAGKRKRSADQIFPNGNPIIREKLMNTLQTFIQTQDKAKMITQLLESVINL